MMIDYNHCIMEQIDTEKQTPQQVADIIFKAKDHRMSDFSGRYDDTYKPLEGLTAKEREYCLQHQEDIEQGLNDMTMQEHLEKTINRVRGLLDAKMKHVKSAKK